MKRVIDTVLFRPRDAKEQRIRDLRRGIQHGPDDLRNFNDWGPIAEALVANDPAGRKQAVLLANYDYPSRN